MKTQAQHTAEPWIYDADNGLISSEAGSPIAILQSQMPGRPIVAPNQMHVNGELLAAAPELAHALAELVKWTEDNMTDAEAIEHAFDAHDEDRCVLCQAQAALKKAGVE